MARRLIKKTLTDRTIADILIDEAHSIATIRPNGNVHSYYSVQEFNRILVELVVKECADTVRRELLLFTDPNKFTGRVNLEETLYSHFNMEVCANESNS